MYEVLHLHGSGGRTWLVLPALAKPATLREVRIMRKLPAKLSMFAVACLVAAGCGGGGGSSSSGGHVAEPTYTISGSVTSGGTGVQGATVTLGGVGAATAFTNSSGIYRFSGLGNGNYTVTTTKPNYSCSPKSSNYTINGANLSGANFTVTASSTIFYVTDDMGQLASVDVAAKSVTIIGNTGVVLNDIAFDAKGNLFGVSNDSLYRIDPITATATPVGALGIAGPTSLEFGDNGLLYTANSALYTVNAADGVPKLVGNGGVPYDSSGDLIYLGNKLYLTSKYNPSSDILVTLDTSTGVATAVGPIGFVDVFGLATNDNVTLYGFSGTKVIKIDPVTGAGTLFWDMNGANSLGTINGAAAH